MKNSPFISSTKAIDEGLKLHHHRKNIKEAVMPSKTFTQAFTTKEKKEHGLKLPLSTLVRGNNNTGKHFLEKTELDYISHRGASLKLKNPVDSGSKLELIIDLPPDLGENNLKLFIQGKVVLVEKTQLHNSPRQVSLRFKNKYKIQAEEE